VVYKASETLIKSGVEVGDLWFSGFPMENGGYITLFAIPHDATKETSIALLGDDLAQNRATVKFHYRIKTKTFRTDTVQVNDDFLQRVMPYFTDRDGSLGGDPLETFKKVNGDLRQTNEQTIRELCQWTAPQPLWSGAFLRLAASKTMSRFADYRIYTYGGEEIDRQFHLGVDLASVAMSPVEASNRGMVAYADELGIYGNTVLLNHGCGLFSMYGHLSRIDVRSGQMVERGETIGTTGSTGLAGGDHLHFSILVSGVYVNPVEWWDPHWIEDNISSKLAELNPTENGAEQ
jgi:murein DD-endopeptidase MepM/ murein hydrolase activator NlpD